jgi:hypothetical protein
MHDSKYNGTDVSNVEIASLCCDRLRFEQSVAKTAAMTVFVTLPAVCVLHVICFTLLWISKYPVVPCFQNFALNVPHFKKPRNCLLSSEEKPRPSKSEYYRLQILKPSCISCVFLYESRTGTYSGRDLHCPEISHLAPVRKISWPNFRVSICDAYSRKSF